MKNDEIRAAIIGITIDDFAQPRTPEEEIERRGYNRAKGCYAEAKLELLKKLGL